MSACRYRMCVETEPHVHPSETTTAKLAAWTKPKRMMKLSKISNVDWAVPAVRYDGRWVEVSVGVLESIWPLVRDRVMRSAPRPAVDQDQEADQ